MIDSISRSRILRLLTFVATALAGGSATWGLLANGPQRPQTVAAASGVVGLTAVVLIAAKTAFTARIATRAVTIRQANLEKRDADREKRDIEKSSKGEVSAAAQRELLNQFKDIRATHRSLEPAIRSLQQTVTRLATRLNQLEAALETTDRVARCMADSNGINREMLSELVIDLSILETSMANLSMLSEKSSPFSIPIASHLRAEKATINEIAVIAELMTVQSPPALMIDVGAHCGESAARYVAEGWVVHAFEPDTNNRAALTQRFGSIETVTIDPRAVSNHTAKNQPFFTSPESTGISTLRGFTDSHVRAGDVDTITLADYCSQSGIERIDFLKIDTEGFDLMVLEGFDWSRFTPTYVLCEFEDHKTIPLGYSATDLANFLVEKGYQVWVSEWFPVRRYGIEHDWRSIAPYPTLIKPDSWGNLLATRLPWNEYEVLTAVKRHTGQHG